MLSGESPFEKHYQNDELPQRAKLVYIPAGDNGAHTSNRFFPL